MSGNTPRSARSSALVAASRAARGLLSSLRGGVAALLGRSRSLLSGIVDSVPTALDYAWFVGSTALLLSLPLLVEVQRESSILVMQRLRERELEAIQQQARMQNAGMLEQLKNMAAMASGKPAGTV